MTVSKFLAYVALGAAGITNTIALYWFGFGLWPSSWWAVIGYGIIGFAVLRSLAKKVDDD